MLKPGGRLLVISRARDEEQAGDGPPWPLALSDIEGFSACGLEVGTFEDIPPGVTPSRHWRAVLRRQLELVQRHAEQRPLYAQAAF